MTNQPTNLWTKEQDDLLKANYHLSEAELCSLFPNRTWDAIYQRGRKTLGLARPKPVSRRAWSEEHEQLLREGYGRIPTDQLAKQLGRKQHAVEEYARRRGLSLQTDENGDTINTVGKASLHRLLDGSPQSFYWMGYLMADGYMHHGLGQIVLVSAKNDCEHMSTYAAFLNSERRQYTGIGGFTGLPTEHCRVSIADNRAAGKIAERFDWMPRKTYNPPRVTILERAFETDDQFVAFLIGFIDGDGHIAPAQNSIRIENHASWLPIHEFFLKKLRSIGMLDGRQTAAVNGAGYSDFDIPKHVTIQLKTFIARHNLTVLDRKWNKVRAA